MILCGVFGEARILHHFCATFKMVIAVKKLHCGTLYLKISRSVRMKTSCFRDMFFRSRNYPEHSYQGQLQNLRRCTSTFPDWHKAADLVHAVLTMVAWPWQSPTRDSLIALEIDEVESCIPETRTAINWEDERSVMGHTVINSLRNSLHHLRTARDAFPETILPAFLANFQKRILHGTRRTMVSFSGTVEQILGADDTDDLTPDTQRSHRR